MGSGGSEGSVRVDPPSLPSSHLESLLDPFGDPSLGAPPQEPGSENTNFSALKSGLNMSVCSSTQLRRAGGLGVWTQGGWFRSRLRHSPGISDSVVDFSASLAAARRLLPLTPLPLCCVTDHAWLQSGGTLNGLQGHGAHWARAGGAATLPLGRAALPLACLPPALPQPSLSAS